MESMVAASFKTTTGIEPGCSPWAPEYAGTKKPQTISLSCTTGVMLV
jgi:hypothetical protein